MLSVDHQGFQPVYHFSFRPCPVHSIRAQDRMGEPWSLRFFSPKSFSMAPRWLGFATATDQRPNSPEKVFRIDKDCLTHGFLHILYYRKPSVLCLGRSLAVHCYASCQLALPTLGTLWAFYPTGAGILCHIQIPFKTCCEHIGFLVGAK